jgi:hypothetical protein
VLALNVKPVVEMAVELCHWHFLGSYGESG